MKPAPFDYHAPTSLDEATALLAELGDDAKVLAGGQSLVPMMAFRLAIVDHLVDIGGIDALRGVRRLDGQVVVGAGTRHAAIEHDPVIDSAVPLLAAATPLIGHLQIRNRGTIGGSLAHADPAAEYPAVALALDAEVTVVSAAGTRTIAARDLFDGVWTTTLDAGEVLADVRFPVWAGRCGFAVEEFARRHGDFAVAGAAVGIEAGPDDRVSRCAIALFGLGSTPLRAAVAETALVGSSLDGIDAAALGQAAVEDIAPPSGDLHGGSEYRRRVGAAMVERALGRAVRQIVDGSSA